MIWTAIEDDVLEIAIKRIEKAKEVKSSNDKDLLSGEQTCTEDGTSAVRKRKRISDGEGNDQHKNKKRSSGGGTRNRQKDNALFASFLNNSSSDDSNDEQEEVAEESIESIVTKELENFKKDKGVHLFVNATDADKGFNCPLQWWKLNHGEYPNIWMLAKRILSVPATSAPSERVFSVASLIATKKRGSLKPDNVNMLVFLKENFDLIEW